MLGPVSSCEACSSRPATPGAPPSCSRAPRWSPDGRSFLFNGSDHNGRGGLFQVDVQTGETRTLTLFQDNGASFWSDWAPDGKTYRLYPSSVPKTDELTRRGYTEIVRKRVGPSWTPTAAMRERDPSLPEFMPPGEGNPLGTHALYLSWPAYLVHGTHDTRKIGRQSSSGCIGLYNQHVEELYPLVQVGTQVRLL